jgi:hypothetical protein
LGLLQNASDMDTGGDVAGLAYRADIDPRIGERSPGKQQPAVFDIEALALGPIAALWNFYFADAAGDLSSFFLD